MSDKGRIRLAEAMGWWQFNGYWQPPTVSSEFCEKLLALGKMVNWAATPLPDPFTDANDDYAVLGFFRDHQGYADQVNLNDAAQYSVGDYARAALKVLEQTDE